MDKLEMVVKELQIVQREQRDVHNQVREAREVLQLLEQRSHFLAGALEALTRMHAQLQPPSPLPPVKKPEAPEPEVGSPN